MEKVKREIQENMFIYAGNGMQPVMRIVGNLPRGMKVVYSYYAGNTAVYGAVGDGRIVLMSNVVDDCFEGEFFSYKSYMSDKEVQPIEEKRGIGIYYCENEEPYTEEELENAIKNAVIREQNRINHENELKLANEREIEELKKEYDFLTQKYQGMKKREETNNVRKLLKKHFPNVKFSVRYDSFSGGDSITVSWNDGPLESVVNPVVKKFQDSHSDYSGDYWDYNPSNFNNLFGGFKYVSVSRGFNDETIKEYTDKIIEFVPALECRRTYNEARNRNDNQEYFREVNIQASNSELDRKLLYYIVDNSDNRLNAQDVALIWLRDLDLSKKEEKMSQSEEKSVEIKGEYQIIDYSEKAIAVIGDTKAIKEQLKELGGRFNPRLSCGAGWIFSKKKENELKELLKK